MGTGAKQPTQQNVVTTTTNLPEYAQPYFENVLQRAQAQSYQQYTPYQGDRIAGFTPQQLALQQNVYGLAAPMQGAAGSALATQAGLGALTAGQYTPGTFYSREVSPYSRYAPQLQQFQMEGPQSFTQPGAVQSYMSPYIQGALDVQRREAISGARQGQLAADLGAVRQGTYGGSRQLLAAIGREKNLGQQLADIEATGMQQAYGAAQGQFNTEQAARQAQARANLEAALGTQRLGAEIGMQGAAQGLQAEIANQQQMLEAQRLAEQSRQFGAGQGLQGYQLAGQMGQTLGNLGQYQQQLDLQRLQAQQQTAAQPQALYQQYLDQQYADFLRQRDYPFEQLGYFSNLLRGLPVQLSSTQTSYAQPPSMAAQIAGGGLGAASFANLLGKG